LVTVDAEKLIMTGRRPPHKKLRQETQSVAALFQPSTTSSGATAAAMLDNIGKRKFKNAFYYAPALTSMKLKFAL
jgi:predicted RNase H-like nuclease